MFDRRIACALITCVVIAGACSHQQDVKPAPTIAQAPPPARVRQARRAPAPAMPATEAAAADAGDAAIFFDFDSALLRDEARPVLQRVATALQRRPAAVRIEGNCDELGTVEYNLALGEQRARAAREYLVHLGVQPAAIATVTYGSQRPRYAGHDEVARSKNRRDDVIIR